jgi:quinol monooxygenase YgiN
MTVHVTASFTVREGKIESALGAIRTFLAHTATEPGTLRYESYRSADDPNTFMHFMAFQDTAAEQAHVSSEAVDRFTAILYPACVAEPTFERWIPVPWARGCRYSYQPMPLAPACDERQVTASDPRMAASPRYSVISNGPIAPTIRS